MDWATFEALKTFLNPTIRTYQGGREQVVPNKMLGMTLFFLGSKLPYFQLAGIFGVSTECFIYSTNYIIQLLNDKCPEVIGLKKKITKKLLTNLTNQEKGNFQMS